MNKLGNLTVGVMQDGADFYVIEGGKVVNRFTWGHKVPDADLDAAKRARAWFLAVALPIHLGVDGDKIPSGVFVDFGASIAVDDDEPSWVDSPGAPGNC